MFIYLHYIGALFFGYMHIDIGRGHRRRGLGVKNCCVGVFREWVFGLYFVWCWYVVVCFNRGHVVGAICVLVCLGHLDFLFLLVCYGFVFFVLFVCVVCLCAWCVCIGPCSVCFCFLLFLILFFILAMFWLLDHVAAFCDFLVSIVNIFIFFQVFMFCFTGFFRLLRFFGHPATGSSFGLLGWPTRVASILLFSVCLESIVFFLFFFPFFLQVEALFIWLPVTALGCSASASDESLLFRGYRSVSAPSYWLRDQMKLPFQAHEG